MRSGSETASTPTSTVSDPHLSMIRQVYPQIPNGCEECLRLGTEWVHVRPCLTCGHVGCCDSSPLRHARAVGHLIVRSFEPGKSWPIVILHARVLRNPSNAELAAAAGLRAPSSSPARCDLLVVGSGPGGMSAAVYGASEDLRTMVLDGTATGGHAGTSARIENYLGFSASQAEALLCAGDPVAVVGGGNSAGQAAGAMAIRLAFERTRPG